MNTALDLSETKALLATAARAVVASKDRLTKADQDIGDGDHGVGMARGFAALEQAAAKEVGSVAELFRGCGLALMTASGGASGVVFGTLFQGSARQSEERRLRRRSVGAGARGRTEGGTGPRQGQDRRQDHGGCARAGRGRRPGRRWSTGGSLAEVAAAAAEAAAAGVEATRGLVAKIGKAKGLGERTVGFVDPGALTTSILLDSISATLGSRRRLSLQT